MTYPFCCYHGYVCNRIGAGGRGLCTKHYMAERRAGQLERYPPRKTGRPIKSGIKRVRWERVLEKSA